MAHQRSRRWLTAGLILGLAVPAASAAAEEEPTDAPTTTVCVTRALRIGAAEVNGVVRTCQDSVTHQPTEPPQLILQMPQEDGAPISYTPLPENESAAAPEPPDPEP